MPTKIERPRQLIVEGNDEARFFGALLRHLNVADLQIQNAEGNRNFGAFLKAVADMPDFDRVAWLGVVRDAEADPSAALASILDALSRAGLPRPARLDGPRDAVPQTDILILPDNVSPGMLETLCLRSVEADPALECVEGLFDCLRDRGLPVPRHLEKARLQAFLATRSNPARLLGEASDQGVWPWQSNALSIVRAFVLAPE